MGYITATDERCWVCGRVRKWVSLPVELGDDISDEVLLAHKELGDEWQDYYLCPNSACKAHDYVLSCTSMIYNGVPHY